MTPAVAASDAFCRTFEDAVADWLTTYKAYPVAIHLAPNLLSGYFELRRRSIVPANVTAAVQAHGMAEWFVDFSLKPGTFQFKPQATKIMARGEG